MAESKDAGGRYVCNVQTWGSSPSYHQGEIIPEDCPYDTDAAHEAGKILTPSEYEAAHPGWKAEDEAEAELQKKELQRAYPGRDLPTAADPPDPEADKALYADAAPKDRPKDPDAPVRVQQGSPPPPPKTGTSGTRS